MDPPNRGLIYNSLSGMVGRTFARQSVHAVTVYFVSYNDKVDNLHNECVPQKRLLRSSSSWSLILTRA